MLQTLVELNLVQNTLLPNGETDELTLIDGLVQVMLDQSILLVIVERIKSSARLLKHFREITSNQDTMDKIRRQIRTKLINNMAALEDLLLAFGAVLEQPVYDSYTLFLNASKAWILAFKVKGTTV
jgi:hypothetical protein